ncbi:MAG: transposase, family, partial [Cyanobacteria bacterium RYN_339]|nr:transposase, family [Cyanobacteria bacterium RYN_339]
MEPRYRVEKLIRDGIPDLIRANGQEPAIRQVDDAAARPFAALKLIEEAFELFEAAAKGDRAALSGEAADVLEVLQRVLDLHGVSWAEVEVARERKRIERGAFDGNFLLADPPGQRQRLYSHLDRPLLKALVENLAICTRAHLAVSFVMSSGLRLLEPALTRALARGATIRLLTSDYLDVTEPEALGRLVALQGNLELRAYREPSRAYHPKAYLFEHADDLGVAFIGSSNLSASALQHGVEWNYEVMGTDDGWPLAELIAKYDAMFDSPYAERIDAAFVAAYAARRRPRTFLEPEMGDLPAPQILPRPAQLEAMAQLEALREQGETRGMVIAATGIGKTFLAAFDSRPYARVLFLAHRDELLTQAREAFARVRPEARLGYYRGGEYDVEAELLFASVATLSRPEHLRRFAPDHFDYVVVDEFHHAAARSYDAILHYFAPRFLLGLTATPYRADNRDVFALCDGNVAYRVTFMEAIALGWLAPFRYHGIYDPTDYTEVPWRNGRYDQEALGQAVETQSRARAVLGAYQAHPSVAALGFCVSIGHARFMAEYFTTHGVPALAVHSGPDAPDRGLAIGKLRRGDVRVLFTVDLFNEGVDIPQVDLVLFLRPTESATIFLQQLGRGLRLHPGKAYLTALDFIGNYRKAHQKVALISGRDEADARKLVAEVGTEAFQAALPPGVEILFDLQAIDLLTHLAKQGEPRRERLVEAFTRLEQELGH